VRGRARGRCVLIGRWYGGRFMWDEGGCVYVGECRAGGCENVKMINSRRGLYRG